MAGVHDRAGTLELDTQLTAAMRTYNKPWSSVADYRKKRIESMDSPNEVYEGEELRAHVREFRIPDQALAPFELEEVRTPTVSVGWWMLAACGACMTSVGALVGIVRWTNRSSASVNESVDLTPRR